MAENELKSGELSTQQLMQQFYEDHSRREKQEKRERFKRLNPYVQPGQILFVGSSLMEQFPIYEFLQDFDLPYKIYNRGIGGYTTPELLESMDECVYALKPAYVFINIGDQDLSSGLLSGQYSGGESYPVYENNYEISYQCTNQSG